MKDPSHQVVSVFEHHFNHITFKHYTFPYCRMSIQQDWSERRSGPEGNPCRVEQLLNIAGCALRLHVEHHRRTGIQGQSCQCTHTPH